MARYIDADKLKSKIKYIAKSYGMGTFTKEKLLDAIDKCAIEAEPVRHGHWSTWEDKFPGKIPKKKNKLGVFCSECELHADNMSTYCPHCGARMDATQNINTCLFCGEIIPEGRQVCPICERSIK